MSVIDDNWEVCVNVNIKEFDIRYEQEFDMNFNYICTHVLNLLVNNFNNSSYAENITKTNADQLKLLTEKNKQLRSEITVKLNEVDQLQVQYFNYKKDVQLISQEIKDTHEAFLRAKKYYKKYLKLYYTIEKKDDTRQIIFFQFFTETKKDFDNFSVHLQRDTKSKCYKLMKTIPQLEIFTELERRLQLENNVPSTLCSIRRAFNAIKYKK